MSTSIASTIGSLRIERFNEDEVSGASGVNGDYERGYRKGWNDCSKRTEAILDRLLEQSITATFDVNEGVAHEVLMPTRSEPANAGMLVADGFEDEPTRELSIHGRFAFDEEEKTGEFKRDDNRCAVCGWPLAMSQDDGTCLRGNCSMRPRPENKYDGERAEREHLRATAVLKRAQATDVNSPLGDELETAAVVPTHSIHGRFDLGADDEAEHER